MKMFSDISSLIFALNEEQRKEFSDFIKKMRTEGLDEKLSDQFSKFTCDDILEDIKSTTEFERKQKEKEIAVKKGKTTIPKEKYGVHETHCCINHGCKYGDIDCPVCLGLIKQKYLCEYCSDDKIQKLLSEEQLWNKINNSFIKENRKLKLNQL